MGSRRSCTVSFCYCSFSCYHVFYWTMFLFGIVILSRNRQLSSALASKSPTGTTHTYMRKHCANTEASPPPPPPPAAADWRAPTSPLDHESRRLSHTVGPTKRTSLGREARDFGAAKTRAARARRTEQKHSRPRAARVC